MASNNYDDLMKNESAKLYTYTQIIQVGKEYLETGHDIKNTES